ncbi:MAG: histidine kinase, partial [Rhodothermia bacterium]|nr:histidine kinase [Rhodothermia bacterium]
LEAKELEEATDMREITNLIGEADEFARSLARGLIPVELDAGGLSAAFHRLATNAQRLFDLDCTFEEVGGLPNIENTIATHLYRIAQEGLSNAVRHGQASQVRIILANGQEQVRLRLSDNGRGIPDTIDEHHPGMGIRIMRYRARIIGAILEVRKQSEGGTVIVCTLPTDTAFRPRTRANAGTEE